jgi:GAF domain-containing protein
VLAVPLLRQGELLGVLALGDIHSAQRFGREDADLLQGYAELAAAALADARLHAAARAKADRLMALAHVGRLLTASLERRAVFEAIVDGVERLLGVDSVRIWLLETPDGPFRMAYGRAPRENMPSFTLDLHASTLGQVVQSRRPWQCPDIWQTRLRVMSAADVGLRSCLMIPLIAHGRLLGGLSIFSRQVRTFDAEDVELVQAFGDQAALAVQHAETLARERQASRLEQILARARRLQPEDRRHVEELLAFAERLVELGEQSI